jgi:D-3-phosphoglycerate dehydrogenase / 2-oxoglutarate reductase
VEADDAKRRVSRKVLVTDYAWPSLDIEREILREVDAELVVAETGESDELVALAAATDAILTNWKRVPTEALDGADRCLVVSRYGVGLDNIPVDRATELGILVVNVPDFCFDEVSDHAMALMLGCARRVVKFARATRAGEWNIAPGRPLPRLAEQKVGLIGFGNIARALVPKARGFGLRVLAWSPSLAPGAHPDVEVARDLDQLLAESDYVSIHAPATPATAGLIGERELRLMKSTAFLVNTSRGALVDEEALARALREGWIAGAALDVLRQEPPPPNHPLLGLDNVVVTPHAAFYSESAIAELQTKAAANVASVLTGRLPTTVVNPAVRESTAYRAGL